MPKKLSNGYLLFDALLSRPIGEDGRVSMKCYAPTEDAATMIITEAAKRLLKIYGNFEVVCILQVP